MNSEVKAVSEELNNALFPPLDDGALGELVRQLKDVREQIARMKKAEDGLRAEVLQALDDRGGDFTDEVSGLRAYIDKVPRWEYDASALHKLVTDGVLYEKDFADCLVTSVDKKAVAALVDKGLLNDRQLAAAKVMTKAVETLQIKEANGPRR